MNRRSILALALALSLLSSVFAQQGRQQQPTKTSSQDEDVVKITTNLVQIDAIVTDKQGRVVTDLQPQDFQIFEDGHPQPITNFSFVQTNSPHPNQTAAANPAEQPKSGSLTAPVPPVRLRPEQVR